jgi:hypothetical protein
MNTLIPARSGSAIFNKTKQTGRGFRSAPFAIA